MNLKESVEILAYYNKWRRGNEDDMPYTPKQIGICIDVILEYLKKPDVDDSPVCDACYGKGYEDGGGDYADESCMVCNGTGKIKKNKIT